MSTWQPILVLVCAFAIDACWGEYPNRWHPVVWMGQVIGWLEKLFLGLGPRIERLAGIGILFTVSLGFAGTSAILLAALTSFPILHTLLAIFLLKSTFALRALGFAAMQVGQALQKGDKDLARFRLRSLCSRNAEHLDDTELFEAAISSLAENLADSVIGPLFFYIIAGIPGAVFYRAVNTLDAMIGYRGRYEYLGFASARCDDVLNLIPARLTTALLLLVAALQGYPARLGLHIAWSDHGKTPSPNGGWPMACMAGLLGIKLRKPGVYTLGHGAQTTQAEHLAEAWQLCRAAGYLGFLLLSFCILSGLVPLYFPLYPK